MRQARANSAPDKVDAKTFVTPIPMPRAKSLAKAALQTAAKLFAAASIKTRASDLAKEFPVWFLEHGAKIARLEGVAKEQPSLDMDGALVDLYYVRKPLHSTSIQHATSFQHSRVLI